MTAAIEIETTRAPRVFGHVDRAVLEFERLGTWSSRGRKESEVRARFGMSLTAYYLRLHWILEQPEAAVYDAQTVRRLIRAADQRRGLRTRGTTELGLATSPDPRGVRPAMFNAVTR